MQARDSGEMGIYKCYGFVDVYYGVEVLKARTDRRHAKCHRLHMSYLIMILFMSRANVFVENAARCRTCVGIAVSFLLAALPTTRRVIIYKSTFD